MNIYCSGSVSFNRPLTKKEAEQVNQLFAEYLETDICIEEGDTELEIYDTAGDCEAELEELYSDFFSIVEDIRVDYYGDYEGGYRITDGTLMPYDNFSLGVIEADDETLIKELKRRGYDVTSKTEVSA